MKKDFKSVGDAKETLGGLLSAAVINYIFCVFSELREEISDVSVCYSLVDLVDFTSQKFMTSCLNFSDMPLRYRNGPPIPLNHRIKGSVGLYDGRILSVMEGGDDKLQVIMELWDETERQARLLVPGCKDIHFNGLFGSPALSGCRRFIFLTGEPSDLKQPRGFWANDDKKEHVFPGEKFVLRPDFGETLSKFSCPRLLIFDIEGGMFTTITIPSAFKIHPAFPTPLPKAGSSDTVSSSECLLFVGYAWDSPLHTPGLSRCFNRKSCIYRLDYSIHGGEEGPGQSRCNDVQCLTPGLYMSLAPTIDAKGTRAVFAGHEQYFSAHCTELSLYQINLGTNEITEIQIPKIRDDESIIPTFNGIYLSSQSESAGIQFLPDDRTVLVPSFSSGKSGIFLIDIDEGAVKASIFPPHVNQLSSVTLLGSRGNNIVFVHQGYTSLRSVWLARVDKADSSLVEYVKLIDRPNIDMPKLGLTRFENSYVSVIQTPNCPAWLLQSSINAGKSNRPLIAYLHGGPHMMAVNQFSPEIANFLANGYDVVIPNYRGSLSFGKSFLHSLVGNAGLLDVQDCHDCVIEAKKQLNPSLVIAYGGSHGGFLTAWLLGHPLTKSTYQAGVLWNPAVDLVSSNLTSDIPEWALSQVLQEQQCMTESPFAPSADFFLKAAERSPMSFVRNVTAPSLVLLGSNDKRVHPSAGLRWAQAVVANGFESKVLWFPGQGHAISEPEYYEAAVTSIAVWISGIVSKFS